MSTSKNKPKEPKIKYDFTEQIRRNNPSYEYDVKSIILNTMGKKKIKKKNRGGLLVTPKLAKRGY
jgi:hypothetical protein